jgi:hypothetical protein
MSLQYSPKIITDSLVMCLDPSQNKSYPTTDLPVKGGLVMWMDAADDSTFSYSSGTTVSQWRDKSGFNYHMTPTSAGPTRNSSLNSRKTLLITSAQQIGNLSINLQTSANTVFVVSRLTGGANGRVLTAYYNNWLLGHWGGQTDKYYAEGWVYDTYNAADTAWRIHTGDWSGSSTDLANFYSSGTTLATNSSAASQGPSGLGINSQGYELSNAEAAEIIVFNRILTTAERRLVHTYLGQKWGISNTDRSIVDLSGNNNNGLFGDGTIANMPDYDFYNKGALTFNSTNSDRVVFSLNSSINITNNITLECFVNVNTFNAVGGIITFGTASGEQYSLWTNPSPSAIYFGTNWPSDWQTGRTLTALNSNVWYHITATFISGNWRIYLNGILDNSGTFNISTLPVVSSAYLTLGVNHPGGQEYLNGKIGNVKIYNKALSAAEVLQNYEAQKSKFANTIVQQGLILNIDINNPYSYGGAGTAVYDVSSTALSWTMNNITYNSDPVKYFSYNGSSSWLESSTSSAYDSQTITMECWCYPSSLSQNGFLFEKGQVNTQYSMFFAADPLFIFRTISLSTQDLTFTPSTHLTVNAWNHIVCTYASGTKTIYVNGTQRVQQTGLTGTIPTGQTNQYIGKYGNAANNYPFNGRIGESRMYNIALSAAQVLQNYNATKGRFGL